MHKAQDHARLDKCKVDKQKVHAKLAPGVAGESYDPNSARNIADLKSEYEPDTTKQNSGDDDYTLEELGFSAVDIANITESDLADI